MEPETIAASETEEEQHMIPLKMNDKNSVLRDGDGFQLLPEELVHEMKTLLEEQSMFIDKREIKPLRYIRKGVFGKVLEVRWRNLRCSVEVCSNHEKVKKHLSTEIKALLSLRHPFIVMFLGAFIDMDNCYILRSEHCYTLEEILFKLPLVPMDATGVYTEAIKIAQGLACIHGQSIIHRNLTPSNILIDSHGVFLVANFENSCFLTTDYSEDFDFVDNVRPTNSYRYMAPEIFSKMKYGEKVDVYSYGLILYAILSRLEPFSNIPCPLTAARMAMIGKRPDTEAIKTKEYCELLDLLWNQEAQKRPTFTALIEDNLNVLNPKFSCSIM